MRKFKTPGRAVMEQSFMAASLVAAGALFQTSAAIAASSDEHHRVVDKTADALTQTRTASQPDEPVAVCVDRGV